jgi:hypothetical protein
VTSSAESVPAAGETRDSYRRVAGALFDALATDGRVQPVLDCIDKPRLLLG